MVTVVVFSEGMSLSKDSNVNIIILLVDKGVWTILLNQTECNEKFKSLFSDKDASEPYRLQGVQNY